MERIAKLSGGVAVIRVGAATETEMKYLKDKIEDAVNATKAAIAEGIVPGGGSALAKVSAKLEKKLNKPKEPDKSEKKMVSEPIDMDIFYSRQFMMLKKVRKTKEIKW